MAQDVRLRNGVDELRSNLDYWLKLHLIPRFGSVSFGRLSPDVKRDIFTLPVELLSAIGFDSGQVAAITHPNQRILANCQHWLSGSTNYHMLTPEDPRYPQLLLETASYPFVLFVVGNADLLNSRQLAVVGSRNPSYGGKQNATQFASLLAESGWCITSGLALGIDALSHIAAMEQGGVTVAVTGCGADKVYPKRHQRLAERIIEQEGAIVTEFLPGTPPKAEHFPRRNRIISGMSLGTLVVEAALKSGSLITARYALEQGREVFAIPGSISNPLSEGGHYLIKQGAKLTHGISDIHDEFQNLNFVRSKSPQKNLQKSSQQHLAYDKLLDSVDFEVTALDAVLERSKLPINELVATLVEYELRGLVAAVPGGYVKLGGK